MRKAFSPAFIAVIVATTDRSAESKRKTRSEGCAPENKDGAGERHGEKYREAIARDSPERPISGWL